MDEDDLNFGSSKARSARQGRRAAAATPSAEIDLDEDLNSSAKPSTSISSPQDRPNKAVSGWGEETPKKPRSRQLGEGLESLEDARLRPSSGHKEDDGSDTDIPVIPELEEQVEDDMSTKIAAAPNVAINRVATYRELDTDLQRQAAFQVLDNEIDLKLLTKSLSPLEDLIEEDVPWDWDRLFTEVSSELTTEWEKKNTEAPEGGETATEA